MPRAGIVDRITWPRALPALRVTMRSAPGSAIHVSVQGWNRSRGRWIGATIRLAANTRSAGIAINVSTRTMMPATGNDRWSRTDPAPTATATETSAKTNATALPFPWRVEASKGFSHPLTTIAPAGTPRPIVERLNREIVAILKTPEVRQKLQDDGAEVVAGTPAAFEKMMRAELEKWSKVVKATGARLD